MVVNGKFILNIIIAYGRTNVHKKSSAFNTGVVTVCTQDTTGTFDA